MRRILIASASAAVALCSQATVYKGDFNGDGKVDLADMVMMADGGSAFDLNADGRVDEADLHCMADLILGDILEEDNGLNVGIGGWDDSGEDFGGTVGGNAPALFSPADCRFSLGDFDYEPATGSCVRDIDFCCGGSEVCALMMRMSVPKSAGIGPEDFTFGPDPAFVADHGWYGATVVNEADAADRLEIRVLLYSPTLTPLQADCGTIARFNYSYIGSFYVEFENCQVAADGRATVLDRHTGAVEHDSSSVEEISDTQVLYDVYSAGGILLRRSVPDVSSLPRGFYILKKK